MTSTPRPELPTVALPGGAVEVLDLPGDGAGLGGSPLLLLHEGLGSVALWRGFPADLHAATGRRTVAWSRHGHGWSDPARLPRPTDFMHREAAEVLPALRQALDLAAPAVLVGHSDGASIALLHAGLGVGAVAALVLLAPHVVVEDVTIAGIEAARDAHRDTDLAARMAPHHRDAEATFRGWNDVWLSADFRSWDIREHLDGVTCPVLLVQGADDRYGTFAQLDMVAAGVRGPVARLELDGCGHSPHRDRPDEVLRAVTAFLADLSS